MKYLVVVERGKRNWSAYCPDVPGCAVAGKTREETFRLFGGALAMHFKGLREDGLPIPPPASAMEAIEGEAA